MRTAKLFLHTLVGFSLMFSTLASALLTTPLVANAATVGIPSSIGYQGRLKTAAGVAVSDLARTFIFQFCTNAATTATCTEPVGSPITQSLTTANGYFSTSLSTVGVDSSFASGNLYLQITVATEILNPTVQVFASPYSMTTRAIESLPVASQPSAGLSYAGREYYDTTNNLFKYYDAGASAWVAVAGVLNGATLGVDNSAATAINVGTGAVAKTITIGNGTSTTSLVLNAGTGNIDIGANAAARSVNVGTGAAAQTVTIGSQNDTSSLTLNSGTGAMNIGTAIAKTITLGNVTGATGVVINTGTAGAAINAMGTSNFTTTSGALTLGTTAGSGQTILTNAGSTSTGSAGGAIRLDADNTTGAGITLDAFDVVNNTTGVITMDAAQFVLTGKAADPSISAFGFNATGGKIDFTTTDGSIGFTANGTNGSYSVISNSDITLNTAGASKNINLGTTSVARNINIGTTNGAIQTIAIGNATPATTISLSSGQNTSNGVSVFADSITSANALTISANALTTGKGLSVASSSTGQTSDSLLDLSQSGVTTGYAGNLLNVSSSSTTGAATFFNLAANASTLGTLASLTGNALTSGNGLVVSSTSAALTGNLFSATSNSTALATNGLARFNFTGAHTGNGLQVDDATSTGKAFALNVNTLTSGMGEQITSNSTGLSSAKFLDVSSTGASTAFTGNLANFSMTGASNSGNTGSLLNISDTGALDQTKLLTMNSSSTLNPNALMSLTSASTAAVSNGLARFNFTGAHSGNGLQLDDVTTAGTVMALNANSITNGNGLMIGSYSTGITTPSVGAGSLFDVTASGALSGMTGSLASINAFGANTVGSTGNALNINVNGAGQIMKALNVTDASTGSPTNGLVRFSFAGAHTANGFQIDDATASGTAMALNANSLAAGNGLVLASTSTGLTGNLFSTTSNSTAMASNGLARFNFTGAHGGTGLQVDDASQTGMALNVTANSLTSGRAINVLANGLTTGSGLFIGTENVSQTGSAITVVTEATGVPDDGLVSFHFDGTRTAAGTGFQIFDASTTLATTMNVWSPLLTTGTVESISADSLTTGKGLAIDSAATTLSGDLQKITLSGDAAGNTGNLLDLTSSGSASLAKALNVTVASTGAFTNGGVLFNFTGAHNGNGVEVDDATSTGNAFALNANSLVTGNGLVLSSTAGTMTGSLFSASASTTSATSNGLAHFNFTGDHNGYGVKVDDATTAGTAMALNATALTTGNALAIGMGSALTTGGALNISGAIYNHAAGGASSLASIAYTDTTSGDAFTSFTNGLLVSPTVNVTAGTATKVNVGIAVEPSLTACTSGFCGIVGMHVGDIVEPMGSTFDSYGMVIGTGWDTGLSMGSKIDMNNNLIENIGNAGTDFVSGGGLTLASTFTANGDVVLGNASSDTLSVNPAMLSFTNDTAHTIKNDDSAADTVGRALTIQGGLAGAGATLGQVGGAISINGGTGSVATGAFTSGNGALVSIAGGTGADSSGVTGTAGNGGAVTIDSGVAGAQNGGAAGVNGGLSIGGTNARTIGVGNADSTTSLTVLGGNKWTVDGTTGNIVTAGTFTQSKAGISGTGAQMLTGAWASGFGTTNTKPQMLIEPSGTTSTGWLDAGTAFGINANSAVFDGSLIDAQVNGVSKFKVMNSNNDVVTVNAGTEQYNNMSAINVSMTGYDTTGDTLLKLNPTYASVTDGQTFDAMKISPFTAAATGGVITDTVNGISIGALTQTETGGGVITSSAINIGSGWDTGITLQHGGKVNDYFTGGAYGYMQLYAANGVNSAGDQMLIAAGSGGTGITSGDGGTLSLSGGTGGAHTTGNGKNGGNVSVQGGPGSDSVGGFNGNGGNGGAITIDGGAGGVQDGIGTPGTNGSITIGGTNAKTISVGNANSSTNFSGVRTFTNNALTTQTADDISTTGLTSGTALNIAVGTALTTGGALNITGANYAHAAAETGTLASLTFTDSSGTNATTSTTNGLLISPTVNATGGNGTTFRTINGISVSPTFTACTSGGCKVIGVSVGSVTDAANFNTSAIQIGSGWDNSITGADGTAPGALSLKAGSAFGANAKGATLTLTGGNGFTNGAGGDVHIDSGTLAGTGATGGGAVLVIGEANAKTINIGHTGTAADTFNLKAGNTGGITVTLPSGSQGSTTALCSSLASATAPTSGTSYLLQDCGIAPTADYAERYPVAEGSTYGDIVVPGTKMVVTQDDNQGTQQIAQAIPSSVPYQGPVYGILSNNYGDFTSAGANIAAADNPMPVALVGRVPVNVTNEGGVIAVGDFITTSSTAGKGMKATKAGRVIGMALSSLNDKGQVMVQVINTWYQPATDLQGGSSAALALSGDISGANATFSGSVTVAEHLYGSHDMAGRARLVSGKDKVHVTFEKAYSDAVMPIVTLASRSASATGAWVSNEGPTGFDVNRSDASAQVEYNWIAIGVNDALVTVSNGQDDVTISVSDVTGPAAPAPVVVSPVPPVVDPVPVVDPPPVVDPTPVEDPAPVPVLDPVTP